MNRLDELKNYMEEMEGMRRQLIQSYARSPLAYEDASYVRIAGNYLAMAISACELEIGVMENQKVNSLAPTP